jgi:acetyl-CoA carboxylase carboxyl transferase subunit alpha
MATFYQLDFEKPLAALEQQIAETQSALPADAPATAELIALREQHAALVAKLYTDLSAWNTVRVARHPLRPQTRDYISMMCRDFSELHGDRRFGDDPAIVTGFARVGHVKCMLIGHQKGKETAEKIACHFGCAHPEGYRKALKNMKLAEKMGLPVVTLVDTQGAYPGLGAEQRGQAHAIAENLLEMSRLRTPIVSVIIGEGGSGGALGIAVADRVGMMQYAWYSVISPEGCAAILWKEANEQTNTAAAKALKLTAADNKDLGVVDEVVPEPLGGAHRNPQQAGANLQTWILTQLQSLKGVPLDDLVAKRYDRFRNLGKVMESPEPATA